MGNPETKKGNGDRSPFAILADGNGYSAASAGAGTTFTSTLRPARLLDDRGHHLGAGHGWHADLVADHQHVGELDGGAGFARDPFDRVGLVGGDGVLLSARADNSDHDST